MRADAPPFGKGVLDGIHDQFRDNQTKADGVTARQSALAGHHDTIDYGKIHATIARNASTALKAAANNSS